MFSSCEESTSGRSILENFFRATKKKKLKRKTANAGTPLTLVLCLSNQLEITVRGRENNILHFSQQEISSLYSVLNIFMGKVANFDFSKCLLLVHLFCAYLQCFKLCCFENLTRILFRINTRNACMLAKRKILA